MTLVPLAELPEFVRNVRAALKLMPKKGSATIVALVGELGAGKTTFVQTLAADMDITERVVSPTYVLMKKYRVESPRLANGTPRRYTSLVHIDAYRLENPKQFAALRPEEFLLDPECLVVVEWPERLKGVLPAPDLTVTFTATAADGVRDIVMDK